MFFTMKNQFVFINGVVGGKIQDFSTLFKRYAATKPSTIISSNCKNGPKEFINNDERGYLYKNYDLNSSRSKFTEFMNDKKKKKN